MPGFRFNRHLAYKKPGGQTFDLETKETSYSIKSDACQEDLEKSDIISSINFDHSAVTLHFSSVDKQKYGPSFWKFNASLVNDTNFVTLLTESIPEWLNEFNAVTDKRVLWDLIKFSINLIAFYHSAVTLHFSSVDKQKYGPSFWKFNASLVNDTNFVTLLTESIPEWLNEFNAVTDKRVLWDLIKFSINLIAFYHSSRSEEGRRPLVSYAAVFSGVTQQVLRA